MSTHCINVFKGLRYSTSGDVAFCCKSELWLDDKDGNKCKIHTHDFNAALNGKLATEIRNDLENGIKHANCKKCWDEEAAGIPSKRVLDNSRAIDYWGQEYLDDKTVEPAIVELNLGTLCNLKCRICGPWSSSRWVEEHFAMTQGNNPNPDAKQDYMLMVKDWQGNYEDDSPAWEHIEKSLPYLKQIDIYGGEPFLVEKQWKILQRSIELGYSKDQILHFNTNATQFNPSHIELLKHFKKVLISLSIDGIGKRFEYQRHPAKWSLVENNITKFLSLLSNKNIHVSVCFTVNTLNVYYLEETLKHFAQLGLGYYINILHGPPYYNIKNIPKEIKQKITEHYTPILEGITDSYMRERIQHVLDFMNTNESDGRSWNEFFVNTKLKDSYRKENFKETFPELCKLIDERSHEFP
jgi:MoaA/NifB/PqqE/SkfB family radical SAM enzyme